MERRPTWAKNFRRFGFKSLRSHSGAPSWRRNASLATSLLMDPRALARSTLPEPLEGRPAVRGLGLEQTVEMGSPLGAQQGLDQGVRSLLCATARRLTSRTIRSGAGKTSLSVRNRSRARRKRTFGASCSRARSTSQASSSSKSRDRNIDKPRCSRTSVKCCEARLLASSVGLNLVRADLELVRDKAGCRIAELRSNCAERSRGSEVHKAEARAPSGLLPPAGWRRGLGRHPSA